MTEQEMELMAELLAEESGIICADAIESDKAIFNRYNQN